MRTGSTTTHSRTLCLCRPSEPLRGLTRLLGPLRGRVPDHQPRDACGNRDNAYAEHDHRQQSEDVHHDRPRIARMPRACVIVLDAVGAGELPDAAEYGDEGSDTLGNVARAVRGLDLPNLEALGLGN